MTLDKQMVYRVCLKDGSDRYEFRWAAALQTWLWAWPDGFSTYTTVREIQEILSLCEHFPEYRTLTISPAGNRAERELPTG